jgi:hypothetical protein
MAFQTTFAAIIQCSIEKGRLENDESGIAVQMLFR